MVAQVEGTEHGKAEVVSEEMYDKIAGVLDFGILPVLTGTWVGLCLAVSAGWRC